MKKESAVEILPALDDAKDAPPRLSLVLKAPAKITDGRDELNFAEFPLSTISDRHDLSAKTIVFEDKIFDRSKNEHLSRKLTITGSDAFGLPTPSDEAVLLALIQLSKMQNFGSKRVYFTRYQILQLLKWPMTGQSYERLDKALNRWVGVTMYCFASDGNGTFKVTRNLVPEPMKGERYHGQESPPPTLQCC